MSDRTRGVEDGSALDGAPIDVVQVVWADALGLDAVDPDAGFFDLGATSAMVVSVVRVLRHRWPRLRIADVFSHSTVAQLADFLDDV